MSPSPRSAGRGRSINPEQARLLARLRSIQLVSNRLVESLLGGNYRSVFRGQGIEFDEVREYVPGDDIRSIDWNVTSRFGAPFTKVFREERELCLFLIVDVSASMRTGSGPVGKDEVALLAVAALALAAVVNNDRVGAVFFSDRIEKWAGAAKGARHAHSLINDFQEMKAEGDGSELDLAIRTVASSLKRRGIVVILSDFKTEGYWDDLTLLTRKHDVVAIRISDPADFRFPEIGLVGLRDPETGQSVVATRGPAFQNAYSEAALRRQQSWISECRRRAVDTLEIRTTEDPGSRLYEFFQRRRRRR